MLASCLFHLPKCQLVEELKTSSDELFYFGASCVSNIEQKNLIAISQSKILQKFDLSKDRPQNVKWLRQWSLKVLGQFFLLRRNLNLTPTEIRIELVCRKLLKRLSGSTHPLQFRNNYENRTLDDQLEISDEQPLELDYSLAKQRSGSGVSLSSVLSSRDYFGCFRKLMRNLYSSTCAVSGPDSSKLFRTVKYKC